MARTIGILIALGAVIALVMAGTAKAAEPEKPKARNDPPTLVAVAIGQLVEDDGGRATVDLRAGVRDGRAGGNLRFYAPSVGYYNGGVRALSVDDGTIKVRGAGGLFRPDGTRIGVRYQAEISADGRQVKIVVQGRGGFEYTLSGHLEDGLVRAGNPQSFLSSAPRTRGE